jgi:AcrR family transcriptional regulator
MDKYHHGDLRRALLTAAVSLVTERSAAGVTLREVARRAGVSHAAPYRHFQDRDALEAGVAETGFRALASELDQAREEGVNSESGTDQLEAVAVAYVGYASRNRPLFRVMFGPSFASRTNYPALLQASNSMFDSFVNAISESQKNGTVRAGSNRVHALSFWSALHGLSVLIVGGQLGSSDGPQMTERRARQITRTLLDGLR